MERTSEFTLEDVGVFEVVSGMTHVTDMCYDVGTWCAEWSIPTRNGFYDAFVMMDPEEDRVAELWAVHRDADGPPLWRLEVQNEKIGVDGGNCGIYDSKVYENSWDDDGERSSELDDVLGTDGDWKQYNIYKDGGVVSMSGWGDGMYVLQVSKDENGDAEAFRIVYIEEEDYE
ncbi:MAG: hypothetical protein ACXABY_12130 [Candidatus Thorarchaeota archaeon]|jgi:hypothetical protein